MLRRFALLMTVLAGLVIAPQSAQAAVVKMDMHNCYFQPWSIVAQAGDTVEIRNLGGPKTIQSYSGTTVNPTPIGTNQTITFEFGGSLTGLQANDSPPNPGTGCSSTVDGTNCTGMCARVTPQQPANPPAQATIATPAANAQLTSNIVNFSGTATNAKQVRVNVMPGNITFYGTVDANHAYSVNRQLPNGTFDATVTSMHLEGFEATASTVKFSIAGGDTLPPVVSPGNPARMNGQPSKVQFNQTYAGFGAIEVNGVVIDDVQAKKVSATVRNALVPGAEEMPITLQCYNPDASGNNVPCNASSSVNPYRIQYAGRYFTPVPGQYTITVTAEDGAGQISTAVQQVFILLP